MKIAVCWGGYTHVDEGVLFIGLATKSTCYCLNVFQPINVDWAEII
jgi:hypothetical protein